LVVLGATVLQILIAGAAGFGPSLIVHPPVIAAMAYWGYNRPGWRRAAYTGAFGSRVLFLASIALVTGLVT
jgi:hypothetical protein